VVAAGNIRCSSAGYPTGTPAVPPPAVQRALYPRDGTFDTLDAQ
jgi:hypothetical protein